MTLHYFLIVCVGGGGMVVVGILSHLLTLGSVIWFVLAKGMAANVREWCILAFVPTLLFLLWNRAQASLLEDETHGTKLRQPAEAPDMWESPAEMAKPRGFPTADHECVNELCWAQPQIRRTRQPALRPMNQNKCLLSATEVLRYCLLHSIIGTKDNW